MQAWVQADSNDSASHRRPRAAGSAASRRRRSSELVALGGGAQSWHEPSGSAAGAAGPAADPLPVFHPAALFVQQRG